MTHVSFEHFFLLSHTGESAPVKTQQGALDFEGQTVSPWSRWTAAVKLHYPHFHIGAMFGPVQHKDDPHGDAVKNLVAHGDEGIATIVSDAVAGNLDSVDLDIETGYVDGLPEWILRLAQSLRLHGIDLTSTECYGSCSYLLDGGVTSVVFMVYSSNFADFQYTSDAMIDIINPDGDSKGPRALGLGFATWWGHLNSTDFMLVSKWFGSRPSDQRHWWHWGLDNACCSHEVQRRLYLARFNKEPSDFCADEGKLLASAILRV